jgi:hypothetical protein
VVILKDLRTATSVGLGGMDRVGSFGHLDTFSSEMFLGVLVIVDRVLGAKIQELKENLDLCALLLEESGFLYFRRESGTITLLSTTKHRQDVHQLETVLSLCSSILKQKPLCTTATNSLV